MRLSDEKARRLKVLVWRERVRRWLPPIIIALGLFIAFAYFLEQQINRADRTVDVQPLHGAVINVKRGGARGAAVVRVHLDDGRDVEAFSALRSPLMAGSHVDITEARHASGRLTYEVIQLRQ